MKADNAGILGTDVVGAAVVPVDAVGKEVGGAAAGGDSSYEGDDAGRKDAIAESSATQILSTKSWGSLLVVYPPMVVGGRRQRSGGFSSVQGSGGGGDGWNQAEEKLGFDINLIRNWLDY